MRQIAETVNQQTTGIEQIFTAVIELNSLMDGTLERITATSNSVGSLRAHSDHVSQVVGDYQI